MYKAKLLGAIAAAVILLMTSFPAPAQSVEISGVVRDQNGPVEGAVVMVKGTTQGTSTDFDGRYTITAGTDAVLEVSCLGYQTITEHVAGRRVVNVTLSEDSTLLSDAVVLGYGVSTRKKDLSASVGIVASPEQLAQHPVTSATSLLQGQLPGVTVTNNGGSPTSGPSLVIRGQGSPSGDSILWVVDGVPGAPINSLSDIESIVVLKDAASAAIYGAQSGAGGVIIVTTKKGTTGVSVAYDGLAGVRSAHHLPRSLDAQEEIRMRTIGSQNAGIALEPGWDTGKNPWVGVTRTDWIDELFRNALYHRHNVVVNAGTDRFRNRISFKLEDNDDIFKEKGIIAIPQDIMLLGVDNDEALCQLCSPTLSSLGQDVEQAGYNVAKMIDGLLELPPEERFSRVRDIPVMPTFVVSRHSTEAYAHPNPYISK